MTVTLYGIPGLCSLAPHIGLIIAGIPHRYVPLNRRTGKVGDIDFKTINPTGAVPALQLEDGTVIAQGQAVFWWIGQQSKRICYASDPMGQIRLLEQFGMSTDLHTGVATHMMGNGEGPWRRRMGELEARLPPSGWILGGPEPSSADLLSAVIFNWNYIIKKTDVSAYPKARALHQRVFALPETQEALKSEGMI